MADMKKVYDDLIINLLEEIETNKTDLALNFNYRTKIFFKNLIEASLSRG